MGSQLERRPARRSGRRGAYAPTAVVVTVFTSQPAPDHLAGPPFVFEQVRACELRLA